MADMGGFKEGDVVRLKSGGPSMTVELIDETTLQISCVWIDKGKQQRGNFAPATLMKVPDPGIPSIVQPRPIR